MRVSVHAIFFLFRLSFFVPFKCRVREHSIIAHFSQFSCDGKVLVKEKGKWTSFDAH